MPQRRIANEAQGSHSIENRRYDEFSVRVKAK